MEPRIGAPVRTGELRMGAEKPRAGAERTGAEKPRIGAENPRPCPKADIATPKLSIITKAGLYIPLAISHRRLVPLNNRCSGGAHGCKLLADCDAP